MAGTDIYIIAGVGKPRVATNLIDNGEPAMMMRTDSGLLMIIPVSMYNYIRANYGRNRTAIGAYNITADSEPDYDNWGPDDYWTCADWLNWHRLNVQKYGRDIANQKFYSAWGAQDAFMSPYNWCKYHNDFANYFSQQGIDVGWLLSHLVVTAENVSSDVLDTTQSASSALKSIGTVVKVAAPFVAIGAGIWAVDKWVYPLFSNRKYAR